MTALRQIISRIVLQLSVIHLVAGAANVTLDDTQGDGNGTIPGYAGQWRALSGPHLGNLDSSQITNGTVHEYVPGSGNGSFEFTFTGDGIWLYFVSPPMAQQGDYMRFDFEMDGSTQFAATYDRNLGNEAIYNELVFQVPAIPPGAHTLKVSLNPRDGDARNQQNHLLFDYAIYHQIDASSSSSVTASPSAAATAPPASSKHSSTGAIAGGVVGGVAILFIIVVAFLIWKRRRQHPKRPKPTDLNLTQPDALDEPERGTTPTPQHFISTAPLQSRKGMQLRQNTNPGTLLPTPQNDLTPASGSAGTAPDSAASSSDPQSHSRQPSALADEVSQLRREMVMMRQAFVSAVTSHPSSASQEPTAETPPAYQ